MTETKILKTKKGLFSKEKKNAFILNEEGFVYNSTLGDLGLVSWQDIIKIEITTFKTTQVIKFSINNFNVLKVKMSRLKKSLSDLYRKEAGADILIFPQDIDMNIDELFILFKKYKSSSNG